MSINLTTNLKKQYFQEVQDVFDSASLRNIEACNSGHNSSHFDEANNNIASSFSNTQYVL